MKVNSRGENSQGTIYFLDDMDNARVVIPTTEEFTIERGAFD